MPIARRRQPALDDQRAILRITGLAPLRLQSRFREDHLRGAAFGQGVDLQPEAHIAEGQPRPRPARAAHATRSMPSLTNSRISISTSLPLPLSAPTAYFAGQAAVIAKRA